MTEYVKKSTKKATDVEETLRFYQLNNLYDLKHAMHRSWKARVFRTLSLTIKTSILVGLGLTSYHPWARY